jgi:hypothetical protein
MALSRENAKAHAEFLNHVKQGNESEEYRHQANAPLRSALRGGYDIAGVTVGKHHEQTRAPGSACAQYVGRLSFQQ